MSRFYMQKFFNAKFKRRKNAKNRQNFKILGQLSGK